MKRLRGKIQDRTGRKRVGVRDNRVLIEELNPILRGWGNYFRTGNAADKFRQVDKYVVRRLRPMVKKRGRNLRAGQTQVWTEDWFNGHGLYEFAAPSATRKQRNHAKKIIGKPYAGKPHVRIERGDGETGLHRHRAPDYQWSLLAIGSFWKRI